MASDKPMVLRRAIVQLLSNEPFFGTILLQHQFVEDASKDTMATDGVHLFYNPKFLEEITFDELKGCLAHEAMHPACLHHLRMGNRDLKKWNRAADYAINQLLDKAGLDLPKGVLRSSKFDGMNAEEIYSLLPDAKDQDGGGSDKGSGGSSSAAGQSGNQPRDNKSNKGQPWQIGEVLPFPGSEEEAIEHEQQMRVTVAQAAQYAKACGKLPAGMERFIDDLLAHEVDWREVMRRFIQTVARNDYTFRKPNMRYLSTGFSLPTLFNEDLGEIVFIVDTSGSLTADELTQFASEINGIMEEFTGVKVTVIYCDAAVNHVDVFEGDLPVKMTMHGGGGTDFRPPFKWLEKNGESTKCAIYATDGRCSSFPDQPDFPVLWLSAYKFEPPFGEIVPLRGKYQ